MKKIQPVEQPSAFHVTQFKGFYSSLSAWLQLLDQQNNRRKASDAVRGRDREIEKTADYAIYEELSLYSKKVYMLTIDMAQITPDEKQAIKDGWDGDDPTKKAVGDVIITKALKQLHTNQPILKTAITRNDFRTGSVYDTTRTDSVYVRHYATTFMLVMKKIVDACDLNQKLIDDEECNRKHKETQELGYKQKFVSWWAISVAIVAVIVTAGGVGFGIILPLFG